MTLATDIAAATTQFQLEQIKAQDYRQSIADAKAFNDAATVRALAADADLKAWRASMLKVAQDQADWVKTQFAALPPELSYKQRLILTIADKYMTTSTAVDPAAVKSDADKDAARLVAAADSIIEKS